MRRWNALLPEPGSHFCPFHAMAAGLEVLAGAGMIADAEICVRHLYIPAFISLL